MDVFEIYKSSRSIEMAMLAACHGESDASLRKRGVPHTDTEMLLALAEVYFGPTTFTKYQRRCIDAAQRNAHSFATLHVIERCAQRTRSTRDAWNLRAQLCEFTGDTNYIAQEGARLLRIYRKQHQKPRQPSVRKYLHGELATLALTGKSHTIADMYAGLKEHAATYLSTETDPLPSQRPTPSEPTPSHNAETSNLHEAMLRVAEDIFFGTTQAAPHEAQPTPTPNGARDVAMQTRDTLSRAQLNTTIVMTLDEATRIEAGRGDDITLRLTNGTTMTGAEFVRAAYVEKRVSNQECVVLVDALRGPVNAYRTRRFANEKQRVMALAENPTCAWPGCRRPGEECQVHHMEPWRYGGETNAENLVTLCAYHNGVNDDDPASIPVRGRMERVNGKIQRVFTPPGTAPPSAAPPGTDPPAAKSTASGTPQ